MGFRTSLLVLTCALLASGLCLAGTATPEGVSAVDTESNQGAVPIEYLAHLPVIKVHINGQGPFDFVVDTGAGVTVFDSELAGTLNIPVVGTTEIGSPMGTAPIEADSLRVGAIQIGDVVVRNTPAVVRVAARRATA